jgi:cell division protein FtsW (lipid II flippase)
MIVAFILADSNTAVHMNVEAGVSPTKMLRRKFLWVLIGLFAPEIVLVCVFRMRRTWNWLAEYVIAQLV